jgi:hypothetical protein
MHSLIDSSSEKFELGLLIVTDYFSDEIVGYVLPLKTMTLEHNGHILVAAAVQATGFINLVYSGGSMKNKLETPLLLFSVLNAIPNI